MGLKILRYQLELILIVFVRLRKPLLPRFKKSILMILSLDVAGKTYRDITIIINLHSLAHDYLNMGAYCYMKSDNDFRRQCFFKFKKKSKLRISLKNILFES